MASYSWPSSRSEVVVSHERSCGTRDCTVLIVSAIDEDDYAWNPEQEQLTKELAEKIAEFVAELERRRAIAAGWDMSPGRKASLNKALGDLIANPQRLKL